MDSLKPSNYSFDGYENPYYKVILNVNGSIALCFGMLAMFLTLFKSPKVFGAYKYFLFNISLWAFAFDVYMTILYSPKLLFPALVMCPDGLLKTKNNTVAYISFFLFLIFFGSSTIAVLSAFIYRYAALKNKVKSVLSWPFLVFLGFLHFTYEVPTIVLYSLGTGNRTAIDEAILTQWPNIAEQYLGKGCAAIHYHVTNWPTYFMLCCVFDFVAGVPIVTTLIIKSFNSLKSQQTIMSPKTYRMHKQLLISLIFQLLVPLCSLFGPFIITSIFVFLEFEAPIFTNQATFVFGTLHSPMNCLMMLYFIPHYRKTLLGYVCCFKSRIPNKWTMASSVQHPSKMTHSAMDARPWSKVNPTPSMTAEVQRPPLENAEVF